MISDAQERDLVAVAMRTTRRLLADGVEAIGGIAIAAGVCGYDRGDLYKAVDGEKRIALEHVLAISTRIRQTNYELATRIGQALVSPLDLQVFPRTTLTDKERADRCEAVLRAMPMGDELVAKILGGTR